MTCPWTWIDQPETLARAAKVLGTARIIAIDTEYNSLHYFRGKTLSDPDS